MSLASLHIVREYELPRNSGLALVVPLGQYVGVIGETTADLVVFNADNVRERFDQARTKANQGKVFVTTEDLLISKDNNVMMTIVEDGYQEGTHDLQKGMCSGGLYRKWGDRLFEIYGGGWDQIGRSKASLPDRGCWENLADALAPWGIAPEDVPSPLNLFQTMTIDGQTGQLRYSTARPRARTRVLFRAEMSCLIGVGACPEGGRGLDMKVVSYE